MFQILHDIGVWQRLNFNWLAALAVHACPCGALSSFSSALSLLRSLTGLNVEQAGEAILSIDVHGLEWAKCALLTHHTSMCRYTYIIGIHWHRYTALHDADSAPSTRSTDSLSTGSAGSKIVSKEIKMQRWCWQSELRLRKVSVVSTCTVDQNRLALRLVSNLSIASSLILMRASKIIGPQLLRSMLYSSCPTIVTTTQYKCMCTGLLNIFEKNLRFPGITKKLYIYCPESVPGKLRLQKMLS